MNLLNWDGKAGHPKASSRHRRSRRENSAPRGDPGVVRQAAAVCLGYPRAGGHSQHRVCCARPLLRRLRVRPEAIEPLLAFWESSDLTAIQTHYVDVFDLSRKHSLYLSYWTDGDTRRRGEVLAAFKQRYRRSGFLVNTGGELPDYLPMVLSTRRSSTQSMGPRCCSSTGAAWSCCGWHSGGTRHAVRRSADGCVQHVARSLTCRPQGRDGDGGCRPSDGDGRPGAEGSSTPSDGRFTMNVLLWGVLPYVMMAVLIGGLIWRYRYDQFGWTTRSSQLYESRLLRIGSPLFHFGILVVIIGHLGGLVIPESWTEAVGVTEGMYHFNALLWGPLPASARW
mgnify:CR=1 FL=1